jgi:hypothetical protein
MLPIKLLFSHDRHMSAETEREHLLERVIRLKENGGSR